MALFYVRLLAEDRYGDSHPVQDGYLHAESDGIAAFSAVQKWWPMGPYDTEYVDGTLKPVVMVEKDDE